MRILITGAAGTGTTTLGRALAAEMGCGFFFDADDYYWIASDPPFQQKQEHEIRLRFTG